LRVPDHPVALALADDLPVITTSANRRGEPPAESLAEAHRAFGDNAHYLDGVAPQGVASTIVLIHASGDCKVLREGVISTVELEASLAS
jgi:tRNA A37 threonylcarbamoyladenosine synthetase subunit TsaC/SUA5/YrdC